ncbi:MAG: glycosyltransferase family 39 protein [Polyangiaceae bacterium]|nr:glycosyltransferase family 39 protein [Polyangiaceae bacterium]
MRPGESVATPTRPEWRSGRGVAAGLLALGGAAWLLGKLGTVYPVQDWLFWRLALLWLYNLLLFAACLSAGTLMLTRVLRLALSPLDAVAFGLPVGVVVFCLLMYLLGALGLYNAASAFALAGGLVALGAAALYRLGRSAVRAWHAPTGARSLMAWLAVPFGVVCLALVYFPLITPEALNFDSTWYHLTVAQDYAREGRLIRFDADYTRCMPQLTAIIHTWGWLLPMPELAQRWTMPLHTEFFVLLSTLVGIAAVVGYLIQPERARFAWVGFFLFPSIYVYDKNLGGSADHFTALFAPTLFLAAARARRLDPRYLALFGILAGGAILTKYQAVYLIGPCCALLAWAWAARLRRWLKRRPDGEAGWSDRQAVVFGPLLVVAVVLGVTAPHFVKNLLDHGNPVYPFGLDVFGGHPTVKDAAYQVQYYMVDDSYRPRGSLGERLLGSLELLWTFSVTPFYSFTKGWPDFGALFTLSLPLLFWIRRPGRLFAASGVGLFAVFVWAMTYRVDRNLQAVVPLLAAATTATLIRAWALGSCARVGTVVLVAVQVVWGGDSLFYSQKDRIHEAIELVTSGFRGAEQDRDRYRTDFRVLDEVLPPDATVLVRPMPVSLGINRRVMLDQPGNQGLITYEGIGGATALRDYYQRLGITHVAWNEHWPSWTKRSEILVRELFRVMPHERLGAFTVGEVARARPRPDPAEYLVYVHGIPKYANGLYRLDDLGTYEPVSSDLNHYADPLARLPRDVEKRVALLRRASAALVGSAGALAPRERDELEWSFVPDHRYQAFEVYLIR